MKTTKYLLTLRRPIKSGGNSETGDGTKLSQLDWANWWQDRGYIHVRKDGEKDKVLDETWHRVYPKVIPGYVCSRVAVYYGVPHWLHDPIKPTTKPTTK